MLSLKTYHQLIGFIFLVIGLIHISRLIFQWSVVLAGWTVPMWVSWVALVLAGYLSYNALRLSGK